ncbi:glycoside hydrolase family 5 protein [Nocardiopsis alba]|uniref:glycoside hydrolase family 5 protein n=1 Tax=Nocardiopsis alba TaxID=53437 RepID=UPI0003496C78|nr:glycoside hydrolase family 5 protein [Nocardiopsis alba]
MKQRPIPALAMALALVAAPFAHAVPAHADSGFRVDDGRLVDAAGNDFVIRGVSHPHTWFPHETGALADIGSLGANTVRVVLSSGDRWQENGAEEVAAIVADCKENLLICMLEVHDTTGYGEDPEAATLEQAVDHWLRIQDAIEGEEEHVLVNIANEPFGNDEATNASWASETSEAIRRLRAAGFDHTLVVDAPNWGQDWTHTMRDGAQEVFDSDPHSNTVFSIHMYGVYEQESVIVDYLESFTDRGLPLVIGEFGFDHSDGDPDEDAIMRHAERLGLGYIGWSWSGNGAEVAYLDMVENFDVDSPTPWGDRIIHGPDGIVETSVRAPVYGAER